MTSAHPLLLPQVRACDRRNSMPSPIQLFARKCKALAGITSAMIDGRDEEDEPYHPVGIPPRGMVDRNRPHNAEDLGSLCRAYYREWRKVRRRTSSFAARAGLGPDGAYILGRYRDRPGSRWKSIQVASPYAKDAFLAAHRRLIVAGYLDTQPSAPSEITDAGRAALARWEGRS